MSAYFKVISLICLILLLFQYESGAEISVSNSGKKSFLKYCSSCHSTQRKLIGPALNSSLNQRPRQWLYEFARNGMQLVNNKDSLAIDIYDEYQRIDHPDFSEKLTKSKVKSIIDYLLTIDVNESPKSH